MKDLLMLVAVRGKGRSASRSSFLGFLLYWIGTKLTEMWSSLVWRASPCLGSTWGNYFYSEHINFSQKGVNLFVVANHRLQKVAGEDHPPSASMHQFIAPICNFDRRATRSSFDQIVSASKDEKQGDHLIKLFLLLDIPDRIWNITAILDALMVALRIGLLWGQFNFLIHVLDTPFIFLTAPTWLWGTIFIVTCTVENAFINVWASLVSKSAKARLLFPAAAGEKADRTKGVSLDVQPCLARWPHWLWLILNSHTIYTGESSLVRVGGSGISTGTKIRRKYRSREPPWWFLQKKFEPLCVSSLLPAWTSYFWGLHSLMKQPVDWAFLVATHS